MTVKKPRPKSRRKRADGELSRDRILDAATEIAANAATRARASGW